MPAVVHRRADRRAVLVEQRRGARPRARARRRTAAAGAPPRCPPCCAPFTGTMSPRWPTCGSSTTASMPLIGANGTSLAFSRSHHSCSVRRAETPVELRAQRLVVGDARQALAEARVARELVGVQRLDQSQPEFFQRRQVDGDEPVVGGAQDVGLREARAVRGFRHGAQREERRERLDGEMRHGFEHGHFHQLAAAAAGAFEQRAQHAERRVDAGDRVGQRRPEKPRPVLVDHHAQEARQRLRHRVVARALDVRAAAAEPADRAIHQARIELAQPRRARAELLGRARTEILDVDVGVDDQPLEQLAIGRPA